MKDRQTIFISHATPTDNDFTQWLALKLIGLGYKVWCDILFLDKGVDFWSDIEKEIRENTIKFLVVSTAQSNQREGVLKEIAVASKVKKQLDDPTFIIPLGIDEDLSYDDINIELVRLNAIDFKNSWGQGLTDLIKFLEKHQVPKNVEDFSKSNEIHQQIFLHNKNIIDKEEAFDSNWFPITAFPPELRFHKYERRMPKGFDFRKLTFPGIRYKDYLCTFAWEYDFIEQMPKTETYDNKHTIRIPTEDVISGTLDTRFIKTADCQRKIVQLLNKSFENLMIEKTVRQYEMSHKLAYWIEKDILEKNKFEKVQLVGKQKDKNWHFSISGEGKLYPFQVLMISSHIFFTENGKDLIESKRIQHSSRRRQGRSWWNDKWRSKLLAFVKYISDQDDAIVLEVGSEEKIYVSNSPMQFTSQFSYEDPSKSILEEESEVEDLVDQYDEEYDEIEFHE